jgi:large subunit ribosomal protein L7/L12
VEKADMSEKIQSIIATIEELNVLELNSLVKSIEQKWGVSAAAAAPAMVMASPGAGGGAAAAVEEQTEFKVTLKDVPPAKKIQVIKAVREVTELGLKEAKDLVDGAPKVVKESVTKDQAAEIKKKFEDAGATVVIE